MTTSDDKAFLDGLAGRLGSPGLDHAEGQRLRAALLADGVDAGPAGAPDWESVSAATAANEPRFGARVWAGGAAAALSLCALGLWWTEPTEPTTMRGTQGAETATWLSAQPRADALALAAELRAIGAQVDLVMATDGSVTLSVQAEPGKRQAVDERLAGLETALNPSGHLHLVVRPAAAR